MDELRERVARALWDHGERESQKWLPGGPLVAWEEVPADDSYRRSTLAQAEAVIAALGLVEETRTLDKLPGRTWRHYVTPWERTEEDG